MNNVQRRNILLITIIPFDLTQKTIINRLILFIIKLLHLLSTCNLKWISEDLLGRD